MPAAPPSATVFVARLLLAAVLRFRGRTAIALVLVVLAKLAMVAVPLVLKSVVDALGRPPPLTLPLALLLGYAILRFLGTLFGEIRDLVFARVTQKTVADFLLQAFQHLHRLSVRFHAIRRTGGVTRDVERGTAGIGFLLGVGLFTILPTLVEIGAIMVVMSSGYAGGFTLVILATFVIYGLFTVAFTERRAIYQRALNELDSNANSRLVDSLLNFETVKFYTNEDFEKRHFEGILGKWIEVGVDNQKALSTLHVGQSGIIALGVASIMVLAGYNVVAGQMTVGDLVLVNAYVIQVCLPLNSLGFVFRQARDAIVNAEKMFRLLEQKPEIEDKPGLPDLRVEKGEIRFDRVDFGYEPSRQILWDVSFSVPPGGTVAVVGGSGSGKSTLARLLFRFYEAGAGRIGIDGQDIRGVTQRSLRAAIGIVPQDTILFNDTVAYNIAYGRPGATLEEVIEAAKAAHVHDFIDGLPDKYDTQVGERGVKLSGGEKQRIAIARAILKNPPILVFDEATSALDTRAERAIQEELDRLARDRTTLVIAHRLSTVVDADEILVLEHGRVVERGRHEDLLKKQGLYSQMWRLQRQQQQLEETEEELALRPVDLIALVATVVDGLKPAIDARHVSFYSTVTTQSARFVGDPALLHQALWALGERAVLSTPAGGRVELHIDRGSSRLRLALTHGAVLADRRAASRGRSLGLEAIRTIIAQHGGSLVLEPQGEGSLRTVVEFPLPEEVEAPLPVALPRMSVDGLSILVVDGDADERERAARLLREHGADARGAPAGAAVLDELRELPRDRWPDVLVYDLDWGEEEGFEVIQSLRRLEAERRFGLAERLPAIALSGQVRSGQRARVLLAGFQVLLAKPFDQEQLLAAVASLTGRSGPTPLPVEGGVQPW
ncbi:MAG TPA: ABC transporter transmembrane domain-containing protein [Rhodocyclaceae bacterium]|nr:ABC transporter transmembrane domain-containing protein [Rhodocyclaceae bacterium]